MSISRAALSKLEQNEASGTISIAKLSALADALDCELVYGFVPKQPFEETAAAFEIRQLAARKRREKLPRLT